jgi:hypothetical protein
MDMVLQLYDSSAKSQEIPSVVLGVGTAGVQYYQCYFISESCLAMDGLKEQLDASCSVAALYCLAAVPSSSHVAAVDEKVLYYLARRTVKKPSIVV